jgi:hypothetical protein
MHLAELAQFDNNGYGLHLGFEIFDHSGPRGAAQTIFYYFKWEV